MPYTLESLSSFTNSAIPSWSTQYFTNEIDVEGSGITKLVGSAFANSRGSTEGCNTEETEFHLLLVSLLQLISVPKREILLNLLH